VAVLRDTAMLATTALGHLAEDEAHCAPSVEQTTSSPLEAAVAAGIRETAEQEAGQSGKTVMAAQVPVPTVEVEPKCSLQTVGSVQKMAMQGFST
jgi:hypothetical protein